MTAQRLPNSHRRLDTVLACLLPILWAAGLHSVMTNSNRLLMRLLLLPCLLFMISAHSAWRVLREGEDRNSGFFRHFGIYTAGFWLLPFVAWPLTALVGYPTLLPPYLIMLIPAVWHALRPLSVSRFGLVTLAALLLGLIYIWLATFGSLAEHVEVMLATALATMPCWSLAVYLRLLNQAFSSPNAARLKWAPVFCLITIGLMVGLMLYLLVLSLEQAWG